MPAARPIAVARSAKRRADRSTTLAAACASLAACWTPCRSFSLWAAKSRDSCVAAVATSSAAREPAAFTFAAASSAAAGKEARSSSVFSRSTPTSPSNSAIRASLVVCGPAMSYPPLLGDSGIDRIEIFFGGKGEAAHRNHCGSLRLFFRVFRFAQLRLVVRFIGQNSPDSHPVGAQLGIQLATLNRRLRVERERLPAIVISEQRIERFFNRFVSF